MKIKIYGGLNEVGGNIISLDDKIILDFGLSFSKLNKFYNQNIEGTFQPLLNDRTITFLKRLQLIPENFNNIFFNDKKIDENKFFLITHAHSDHCKLIKYLHPNINIFISNETYNYFKIIDNFNYENFEEGKILNDIIDTGFFSLLSTERRARNINIINYRVPFQISDYTITPFYLDHSYENTAYLIEKDKKTILYTGDYYLSVNNLNTIKEIVKNKKINVLISEITFPDEINNNCNPSKENNSSSNLYFNDDKSLKEKIIDIKDKINEDAPIFVVTYPRYYRRILEMIDIFESLKIKRTNNLNYFLNTQNGYTMLVFDKLKNNNFYVLSHPTERLSNPKKQLIESNLKIYDYSKIDKNSIVFMYTYELINLFFIDRKLLDGASLIISTSSPFDIIQEVKEECIYNIAKENNINVFRIHKSSHLNIKNLDVVLDVVKPDIFIPVHTSDGNKVISKYKNAINQNEVDIWLKYHLFLMF